MKSFFSISIFFLTTLIFSSENLFSQNQPFWSNNGNNVGSNDFFGSINSQSLIFKTNNLERFRINPSGFVGIGTTTPLYMLDVNGSARFNGTIYAQGIVLATRMQADTFKSTSLISVNNTLQFSGGTLNNIYTSSGDLRFQSNIGNNGNTLLNVGTSGNVGVGIFSPLYKVDILGSVRVSDRIYVQRIVPLPGDSEIHFGDSSLVLGTTRIYNNIFTQGVGIGVSTNGSGPFSVAIGYSSNSSGAYSIAMGRRVISSSLASNSITIGSGVTNGPYFINNIPNSFAVAFNSTVPTFFVSGANGTGTTGKVGIGTTNPIGDFQVGNSWTSVSMGGTFVSANSPLYCSAYYGLNVGYDGNGNWIAKGNATANGGVAMLGTQNGTFEIVNCNTTSGSDQSFDDNTMATHTNFEVRSDGKVVIGNNPEQIITPGTYRLYVSDGIITEKLKVVTVTNWSDYVFDSSYVLTPLNTISDFINKYHHLPNVPTAAEVQKNGVDVANDDAMLLAKVEELYLYTIELQKQNAAMQKEIDELKKK